VRAGHSDYREQLAARLTEGIIAPSRDGKVTVDVLGRYRFDQDTIPHTAPDNLVVTFRTAHGSNGLEADYIVLPRHFGEVRLPPRMGHQSTGTDRSWPHPRVR
jgi:hypothetical protein